MPEDTKLQEQILNSMDEQVTTEVQEPQKIKLGDAEYSQEELQDLVGLGKLGKELESKWNTKMDSLFPAFTKSQQELKELKTKIEEKPQDVTPADLSVLPADQAEQVKSLLRGMGFVTKEEALSEVKQMTAVERETERLKEAVADLETEINGSDGRPAFKKEEILQHMLDTGIKNPEKAYKDKYESELDAWKEKQFASARKPGLVTETNGGGTGDKQPAPVKITKANLDQLLKEALNERT